MPKRIAPARRSGRPPGARERAPPLLNVTPVSVNPTVFFLRSHLRTLPLRRADDDVIRWTDSDGTEAVASSGLALRPSHAAIVPRLSAAAAPSPHPSSGMRLVPPRGAELVLQRGKDPAGSHQQLRVPNPHHRHVRTGGPNPRGGLPFAPRPSTLFFSKAGQRRSYERRLAYLVRLEHGLRDLEPLPAIGSSASLRHDS